MANSGPHRRFHKRLPPWKPARIALGIALIFGGMLGFLPVLGFWMIPLGLAVLSVDIPQARRWRRRLSVWWQRRRQKRGEGNRADAGDSGRA
ncbi:MAG: hypothetical protein ACE5ED_01105 [Rhodothalassiaceae bacterium]